MSPLAVIGRFRRGCPRRELVIFVVVQVLLGLLFFHLYGEHYLPEVIEKLQRNSPLVAFDASRVDQLDHDSNEKEYDHKSSTYKTASEGDTGSHKLDLMSTLTLVDVTSKNNLPARHMADEDKLANKNREPSAAPASVSENTTDFHLENRSKMIFNNEQTYTLKDDNNQYFVTMSPKLICYGEGTDLEKMKTIVNASSCLCKQRYYGADCGLPDAIWNSPYGQTNNHDNLKRRQVPRRVINGLPLLNEVALLEARVNDLAGAVDLFLLAESNYSAHGDPKKLYIKQKLEDGFLREFHHQILHVFVGFFPTRGKTDNWYADQYLRVYMGKMGIPRISGIRDDDLFILNDADEMPSREVVMFLKLYDGYTEPVALALRWSIYGFFFKNLAAENAVTRLLNNRKELTTTVSAVATMGLVTKVLENDPFMIRGRLTNAKSELLAAYNRQYPGLVNLWTAGGVDHYCGWHCSWCFSPEGIVLKLDSAQAGDKPRWGDYPEKHDLAYLADLIKYGGWFDGSHNTKLVPPDEVFYAPPFLLKHATRFQSILIHPAQRETFPNSSAFIDDLLTRQ
ncbi:beta-1,4-mannosyl-glycoprotein 4-beta-N-acetylglucosaminyltransferase [Hyalella azteca]|uniref:Beta-1,4-mannosyl-glycoprotein 4-beta-N-acetylglucosaminyltransferase n=1 Tax=Hyalella azteca TaxID=294128 RepID=A0A8B7NZE0_HYAAZ|nr:beta-1,4-mannosyl-glycoprotein 4-beta-N-acetylglucosaminyltransferase [Hyalella azteca]XP_018019139.1 beta-1,4-mannosyl-glycoprotein 4-beta-N-acetylglucosaminyltransferase [Hyalella azteca]XP_047741039.1 beta-1,4-mannosyl-glycoprotein 4-beta-N-acetylglucosaminyltransferase [Hyalella azteca]XP_047741040.1 beta-1,4-mannosyl-glycoprotein 4-beta-N-acetylglucosaminyltransferase [Hyalella azteca]XP_047741041.1 beta-1,4-mannosyl-glycoprotein 4-beta-N-acetylglucosaminyltransferase [Hyalella azteca]